MLRALRACFALAACAAPGPERPGAALSAELDALRRDPPVVRVAVGDHAGNAAVLGGGRLASVRHVFEGAAAATVKVDGHDTRFDRLAQGAGGPAGDWIVIALDEPELLTGHPALPRARAVQPDQDIVIVGYLPIAPAAGREELRELVALPGRTVATPWPLRDAARGAVCVELDRELPEFQGLSGSPVLVREDGGWRLCGVYSSQLAAWPWCEVSVVTPLPDSAPGL